MINKIARHVKKNKNISNILLILACLCVFTIVPLKYVFNVDVQNSDSLFEKITAFSAMIVNNWLIDGILHDKFIMHGDFPSIEFEENQNRSLYLSYPPGAFVPLYLVAKMAGQKEISIGFVKQFLQCEFYLAILFLGLLFYVCLMILKIQNRWLIIMLPIILSSLWAFLPFNFYYMRNSYFSDEAVILLSIMFLIIEVLLSGEPSAKWRTPLHTISVAILLMGMLTDYYFFFIAFVTFCMRILKTFRNHPEKFLLYKLFSKTWMLVISVIMVIPLYVIQVLSIPYGLRWLTITFQLRTDWSTKSDKIEALIHHMGNGFTILFIPVLLFVIIFCVIFPFIRNAYDRDKQMIISWLSIIVLSAVLHTLIFQQHSITHEFSMLKYNLVCVFILFSFFCWVYLSYQDVLWKVMNKYPAIMSVIIMFLMVSGFSVLIIYDQIFYEGRTCRNQGVYDGRICKANKPVAKFIRDHTDYYDVLFSPDYEIGYDIHFANDLLISRKRVYPVSSLEKIPFKGLPDSAMINILISEKTLQTGNWRKLNVNKFVFNYSDGFYLFKFPQKSFRSFLHSKE